MSTVITPALRERCEGTCELCAADTAVAAFAVSPKNNDAIEHEVALCQTCLEALDNGDAARHWQCLAGSIWHSEPAVQALSYRILYKNKEQSWAEDILNSVELDEAVVHWAMTVFEEKAVHRDSNGNELQNGDTVVLTQNLNVKGTSFTAPKGTVVRKIRLVAGDTGQIEGKINEQVIVILTQFVRKS
ncbi:PhnA domain-containing protein [Niabella beijingensis]|uniref:PhnA domain-containing protein n=1 Tax=Niabella beijingensis TaxID=2872700 RepID=UPI001CBB0EAA|nr:alkylphosphonate utilization protein [Niabella beijingensis]MBZ4192489.1 PhnA domain-containing protein [Niabella beijingensis]